MRPGGSDALEHVRYVLPGPDAEPLPPEYFLRDLFKLELTAESFAEVARTYGRFEPPGLTGLAQADWFEHGTPGRADEAMQLRRRAELIAELQDWRPEEIATTDEIALHVRVIRALVGVWKAHQDGGDGAAVISAWSDQGLATPKSAAVAWQWFEDFLNKALDPYTPRVAVDVYGTGRRQAVWGVGQTSVYSACALQLFNHIAADAPIRRCANEKCGQYFNRQEGRAEYGQHRSTGVKYCSSLCAKAQSQRNYLERKKAKEAER